MAVKPKESDTFLREVDEELRRERIGNVFTRYGWYILAAVVLLLAAVGGWMWWQHRQEVRAGEASEKLVRALGQLEQNNAQAAAPLIDELVANDRDGYRIAGLFARANAQSSTNAIPAAIETLKSIHGDQSIPQPYRDVALIRQTLLEFDSMQPAQVVERLQPFAQAGNPWHGTAGELVGIALLRQQRFPQAAQVFEGIARDQNVPESIRARSIQMASALGVDATQLAPSAGGQQNAGGGAPAQQPQPAQPAPPAKQGQ